MFVEVRDQGPGKGKLLFRFDPERDLVEIVKRNLPVLVDLKLYRQDYKSTDNQGPAPQNAVGAQDGPQTE